MTTRALRTRGGGDPSASQCASERLLTPAPGTPASVTVGATGPPQPAAGPRAGLTGRWLTASRTTQGSPVHRHDGPVVTPRHRAEPKAGGPSTGPKLHAAARSGRSGSGRPAGGPGAVAAPGAGGWRRGQRQPHGLPRAALGKVPGSPGIPGSCRDVLWVSHASRSVPVGVRGPLELGPERGPRCSRSGDRGRGGPAWGTPGRWSTWWAPPRHPRCRPVPPAGAGPGRLRPVRTRAKAAVTPH